MGMYVPQCTVNHPHSTDIAAGTPPLFSTPLPFLSPLPSPPFLYPPLPFFSLYVGSVWLSFEKYTMEYMFLLYEVCEISEGIVGDNVAVVTLMTVRCL